MNRTAIVLTSSALLLGALGACSSEDKSKEAGAQASAEPLRVERSVEATLTATVKAINYTTREVTLADKSGNEAKFIADPAVKRLNEVKVGDEVMVKYRASLVGELRAPTAEEREHPIMAVAAAGRAPTTSAPAAGMGGAVRIVTTVQAIDLPNMRVTLQGPMGDLVVVKAQKKENVERLKIDDTIVITYSEAMAIAVEKAKK